MKLGDFTTPTGAKGNVFSLGSWMDLVLGVIVFLVVVATGQRVVQAIPANKVIDTRIEPLTNAPVSGASYTDF